MASHQGLSFGSFADDYDRGRSGWPVGMLESVAAEVVLDLAAGTGKLTALLADHYPHVIAVEPSPELRAVLERNVPTAAAFAGFAEEIPLEDSSVDVVFVAEAFHWFDSGVAAAEIDRVLRPAGLLCVCFNEWRSGFKPGLSDEGRQVLDRVRAELPPPGGPRMATGEWRGGLRAFEPLEELMFDHDWSTDAEGVASYYVSVSSMGALAPEARSVLRARLMELIPDTVHHLELSARVFRGRARIG